MSADIKKPTKKPKKIKKKCGCGDNEKRVAHSCPYDCEINGNYEKTCFCCDICTDECFLEI